MKFSGKNSSCDTMKKMITSFPSMRRKNTYDQREDKFPRVISTGGRNESVRRQTRKMGPVCKTRNKAAAVFSQASVEDEVDLDKQLGQDRCLENKECMWLSSDCTSPSSFFEESRLSSPFHLSVDEWLVASATSSESPGSSCGQCCDDSTSCGNSSTPLSTNLDSCSLISDLDRTSFLVSLLDLDGGDSKWITHTESELDHFQSSFPSPAYKSCWDSEAPSFNSCVSTPTETKDEKSQYDLSSEPASEAAYLEDFKADEPLFWPFEWKFDWGTEETWKYFSMSPRKEMIKVGTLGGASPNSIGLKPNGRKMDLKDRNKGRPVFSSESTASRILELKQRNNKVLKRTNTMPSNLRKSTKVSMKIVPLEMEDNVEEATNGKVPILKSTRKNFFEDEFTSNKELPIETVLGLGEFDGHEGVDYEFNEDFFLLDDSL